MCLIIHKPKGTPLPHSWLHTAADYNRDGFGFMAIDGNGAVQVVKRTQTRYWELIALFGDFANRECTLHLRSRSAGAQDHHNTHPLRVIDQIYVMHNGHVDTVRRDQQRSDTWHLVRDYLRPAFSRDPNILDNELYRHGLQRFIGGDNRLVFADGPRRRTVIINAGAGLWHRGIWISNRRWLDEERLGLPPSHPRVPPLRGSSIHFL
jgi:hypothetical protein